MAFIVATYVYASSQGQRTHSARTKKLIPSIYPLVIWSIEQDQNQNSDSELELDPEPQFLSFESEHTFIDAVMVVPEPKLHLEI